MGGQSHTQATFPQERDTVPIAQGAEWASGTFWTSVEREKKALLSPGFETRTAKSVGGRYDYSIPSPENIVKSSHEDGDKSSSSINYDL
jgi:hypothetical protein